MDWKIRKKEDACARCERAFEEGESHFSLLLLGGEALGREDHCTSCFEADEGRAPEDVFWRTHWRPRTKRGLTVDFESIERLFLALDGREEQRLRELRSLLALLLMRKKRLKLVRVKRGDAGESMVMRRPRREEALEVPVFDFTPERASALRAELERIFEGAGAEDLLVPPAPEGADAEPAPDALAESPTPSDPA